MIAKACCHGRRVYGNNGAKKFRHVRTLLDACGDEWRLIMPCSVDLVALSDCEGDQLWVGVLILAKKNNQCVIRRFRPHNARLTPFLRTI